MTSKAWELIYIGALEVKPDACTECLSCVATCSKRTARLRYAQRKKPEKVESGEMEEEQEKSGEKEKRGENV